MVKEIENVKEFEDSIHSWNGLVVVDYFATWCGPCKIISPFVVALSGKYPNVLFLKVDVDKVPQVSEARNVKSKPQPLNPITKPSVLNLTSFCYSPYP